MNSMFGKFARCLTPAVLAFSAVAFAQDKSTNYPVRPIRIIITVAPGAGADFIARGAAQLLTDKWGQNAVVESRSGGGGVVGVELAARATPDGYTILQQGDTMFLIGAQKRVPFDVLKTFEPVVSLSTQPYILLGHVGLPAKSVKELIALSATKPLTYGGGSGIGATVHVGMERLARVSGMQLKYIAYKGSAPAILAVMGGELQMATSSAMAAATAIRTGKVRGIANLGPKRIASLPDLPTIGEQGVKGYTLTNRYNWWVPAKTPRSVIAALNTVVNDGMHTPEMVKRLATEGSEPPDRMTPAELKTVVTRDYAEIERSVKALNLKIQ
jgi:tripartite-type tricarboxylate transporter receptor subunit TctC